MLLVIFGLSYVVVGAGVFGLSAFSQLFFAKALHVPAPTIVIICCLFLVLLFVGNYRTSRDDSGSYFLRHRVGPAGGLAGALFALLVNPEATGKIVGDVLLTGPRLTTWSVAVLRKACRLMRTDLQTTSETLAILLRRLHRTSFPAMAKLLVGKDPMKALLVLQELDCVLFLAKAPAGVILTAETREELNRLLGTKVDFQFKPPPDEPPAAEPVRDGDMGCYELLGIQPTTSLAAIKSAYRTRIKQCHPDKFVGRGADFRQLAEERAKALNEAYEILSAKHAA